MQKICHFQSGILRFSRGWMVPSSKPLYTVLPILRTTSKGMDMSNDRSMDKVCGRCGHTWISFKETPARCPSCGTYHWNGESVTNTCASCGHTWFPRSSRVPLRCPKCKTRSWASGSTRGRRGYVDCKDEDSRRIIDLYMKGKGCVAIAIETGLSLSEIVDTIKAGISDGRAPRMRTNGLCNCSL